MDIAEARRILDFLARGLNPLDGSTLNGEGCWHHPVVIRALLFASDCLLDSDSVKGNPATLKKSPLRSGKSWSQYEDFELRAGFEKQRTLQDLSNQHQRSHGAIIARIVHLGLANDRDEARKILSSRLCRAEAEQY